MEGIWLISHLALWCLVLLIGIVILAHSRLLGLLHHRLGPAAARPMADGPELGARVGRIAGKRFDGTEWIRQFPTPTDLMIVFVSPQCQTCNELIPHLKDFARAHQDIEVVLVSTLEHRLMNQAYVDYLRLEQLTYIISPKLADEFAIEGTPYTLRLDRQGVVTAKGLANNYEHLVSLKESSLPDRETVEEVEEAVSAQTGRP